MRKPFIKLFDKVIILLLWFIGVLPGCNKPEPEYGIVLMYGPPDYKYGMPQTEFRVNEENDSDNILKEFNPEDIDLQNE